MLTGALPFTASDPMEWVHCHIARQPPPPGERLDGVPAVALGDHAEAARQDRRGALPDRRRPRARSPALPCGMGGRHGRIDAFPLGAQDTSDRLLIPEKLYGREREIETLLAAFDRVVTSGTPELVLVSGYSGIGKSSVVNELHKVLVAAARPFRLRQVRPVQARHSVCHPGPGFSEPGPPVPRQERGRAWRSGGTRCARRWARTGSSSSISFPSWNS